VAVRAVERGDAMTPPQLPRDRPVVDVLHPVEVRRFPALRGDGDVTLADRLDGRLRERLDLDEPLA
jgi:hypothetical protein